MRKIGFAAALFVAMVAAPAPGNERSQGDLPLIGAGRGLYLTHCTSCHGADLHGATAAVVPIPDLGLIAARDQGFRRLHVRAHIAEGAAVPAGDYRRDGSMPCWQAVFSRRGAKSDPARAEQRILALVHYLEWAQQEPLPQEAASLR